MKDYIKLALAAENPPKEDGIIWTMIAALVFGFCVPWVVAYLAGIL